ncbi:MAG: BsuPI-related putative proteinase inhibitor [Gemmatimonadaceae bacterium]
MRTLRGLAVGSMIALLAPGCTTNTEPSVDPRALDAALTFDRIADSLFTAGAEPRVSSAYHEVAHVLRRGPELTSVTITVDGVAAEYLATALSFDQNYCPAGALCTLAYRAPLNSMIAWQRSNPRRLVQLAAVDAPTPGYTNVRASFTPTTLAYLDGLGGVYLGTSGTQYISSTPTEQRCAQPTAPSEASYTMPPIECRVASFDVSFDATVEPPLLALRGNTASGTHAITMAQQTVSGAKLLRLPCTDGCIGDPPQLRPPITIGANSSVLQPNLRTAVAGRDVTLELVVRNVSAQPVQLDFNSAQQYDFIVRSAASGALLWQWSANMSFGQSLGSRTLAPGEAIAFTEHWHAPAAGTYGVQALLTSRSFQAVASTTISVQ